MAQIPVSACGNEQAALLESRVETQASFATIKSEVTPKAFEGQRIFSKGFSLRKKTTAEETDFLPKALEEAIGIASGIIIKYSI